MRKLIYSLMAAAAAFMVGVSAAAFGLYFGNLLLKPAPAEAAIIVSKSININLPPNKVSGSESALIIPLPCSSINADKSHSWIQDEEVLSSYPPDFPRPKFIGTFRDRNWDYQLNLYQDAKGIFGEIISPVLEADSPISRLYEATFDPVKGNLQFSAQVPWAFGSKYSVFLRGRVIKGKVTLDGRTETITLRRLKKSDEYPYPWNSRSQFDCAMTLWGRW